MPGSSLETAAERKSESAPPLRTSTPLASPSDFGFSSVRGPAGNLAIQRAARESPTSASNLLYAALFEKPPVHQTHADSIKRMHYALTLAERDAADITQTLIPGYKHARDAGDVESVAELGGRMLGAFTRMNGAKAAVEEIQRTLPHKSMVGAGVDQDIENFTLQQFVDAHAPSLQQKVSQTGLLAMVAMVPHEFRGEEVAGVGPVPDMEGPPELLRARMAGELDRTLKMLIVVQDITKLVLQKDALSDREVYRRDLYGTNLFAQDPLSRARAMLWDWVSRPIDIAYLKVQLGPIWNVLDATAGSQSKPSDALDQTTKQAQHTGWLGDVGEFDIQAAHMWLGMGGQDNAAMVLRALYTTDRDTRARLLMQMKKRNLLHKFCSSFGWEPIKELHDSLGIGFGEIKTDLQRYFIGGKDKWGPSLGSEWESHNNSLYYHIGRLGVVGDALNFVYDLGTFGFNSSYGKSRDAFTSGQMSAGDYATSKRHLVTRTAAMAFVSLLTGGAADKFVRGGAATVSTARAIGAGFAGGTVGSTAGLATSDAYNVYVSGEQESFSSPEDYIKSALVGGAFGAAFSGASHGLSKRALSHVPDEAIVAEEAAVAAAKPELPEMTTSTDPVVSQRITGGLEPEVTVDQPTVPADLPAPAPTALEPAPSRRLRFTGRDPGRGARARASKRGIELRKKMAYDRMSKNQYDPLQDLLAPDEVEAFLSSEGKALPKGIDWHHTRQSSADPGMADVPEHIQPLRFVEHKFGEHTARPGDVATAGIRGDVTSPKQPIYDPNAPEVQTGRSNPNEPQGTGSLADEALSTRDFGKRRPPNFKDVGKVREPSLKGQYDYKLKAGDTVFMRHKATGEWHQIRIENGVQMRKIGNGPWEPVPLE